MKHKKIPWPESVSELYQPSDRCLSANLVPTSADRACHVISVMDHYSRILGFRDGYMKHNIQLNIAVYAKLKFLLT
jgi:hypothetical protein